MDKNNTPAFVGKVILLALLAAMAVAILFGCSMLKSERSRTRLSTAIQLAYDNGGREAVSNKIESLAAEGRIDREQAVRLHALAQLAYEGVLDGLERKGGDGEAPAAVDAGGDVPGPDAKSGGGEGSPEPSDEGDPAAPAPAGAAMRGRAPGGAECTRRLRAASRRNLRDGRRNRIVTRRVLYSA